MCPYVILQFNYLKWGSHTRHLLPQYDYKNNMNINTTKARRKMEQICRDLQLVRQPLLEEHFSKNCDSGCGDQYTSNTK